jgi:hypothetical protein
MAARAPLHEKHTVAPILHVARECATIRVQHQGASVICSRIKRSEMQSSKAGKAGIAVVAALLLSVILASPAFAEEEQFVASATGKLKGEAMGTQKFKTGGGATVECKTATPSGEVTEEETAEQAISVTYGSCSILAIGTASVSLAMYTFFTPLEVSILEVPITIKASGLGLKCTIVVNEGQKLVTGHSMSELEYENKSGKLLLKAKITKIVSDVTESNSESLCGKVGEQKEGVYEGGVLIELEGGTIEVKPVVPNITYLPNPQGAAFNKGKPAEITITVENLGTGKVKVTNIQPAKFYGIKDINCIGKALPCKFNVVFKGAPEPNSENVTVELSLNGKPLANLAVPASNT